MSDDISFDEYLEQQLQIPEVKTEYDKLEDEYAKIEEDLYLALRERDRQEQLWCEESSPDDRDSDGYLDDYNSWEDTPGVRRMFEYMESEDYKIEEQIEKDKMEKEFEKDMKAMDKYIDTLPTPPSAEEKKEIEYHLQQQKEMEDQMTKEYEEDEELLEKAMDEMKADKEFYKEQERLNNLAIEEDERKAYDEFFKKKRTCNKCHYTLSEIEYPEEITKDVVCPQCGNVLKTIEEYQKEVERFEAIDLDNIEIDIDLSDINNNDLPF